MPAKKSEINERDRAILIALREYEIKPGEMLLLGPVSCAIITGDAPVGKLVDKFVIPKSEWNRGQT